MVAIDSKMSLEEVFDILDNNDVLEIDNYGAWYDWFCTNAGLKNRGVKLLRKLKSIKNSNKFNKEETYLFFKNNCPCYGDNRLYDDFRICDKNTRDVLYTIIPRNPYGKAEVWGKDNNFEEVLVEGTWKDVKAFFLTH